MEARMLCYLQEKFTQYRKEAERYGHDDRIVQKRFQELIGCKEMVEVLIEKPVNLRQDGKVTVGL